MVDVRTRTHYEKLGVAPGCTFEELRTAYRRLARECHPDVAVVKGGQSSMAEINEAWRVLSDGARRRLYDQTVRVTNTEPIIIPQPAPQTGRSRRLAWAASVQSQIARLSRLAGRSATQSLLIRQPRAPRYEYERLVGALVEGLCEDTESRVRAARAAGVAPLDLPVGATLVGIRTLADRIRRDASVAVTSDVIMTAELLDRMWDILAHEFSVHLNSALGGNPQVAIIIGAKGRHST
ncbi:MAG: J domain-containing protein [Actinomycetia bacterium]|nr:J domain-containing protein [Actinomycetes bacterium]MCP4228279.1 J domain-containing protein [Actinomycetes bacterium]MCP5031184.1 J domain-containing protein [Actinomycetes bacterium]